MLRGLRPPQVPKAPAADEPQDRIYWTAVCPILDLLAFSRQLGPEAISDELNTLEVRFSLAFCTGIQSHIISLV